MAVHRHGDVDAFLARADPFLMADEARYNLELGVCDQVRTGRGVMTGPPYLATAEYAGAVTGVVIRTPPWGLLSALSDADDAQAVIDDVLAAGHDLPGCQSEPGVAAALASAWTGRTGGSAEPDMHLRNHVLDTTPEVPDVPGATRPAEAPDRDLLLSWMLAFEDEAQAGTPVAMEDMVDAGIRDGRYTIWERDGEPVSLTGVGSTTPNGRRVGPVYTPPEHRGNGYAHACVAAVSRRELESGRRFCFLYTDQSNPTSNALYARIGYRPLNDVVRYAFRSRDQG